MNWATLSSIIVFLSSLLIAICISRIYELKIQLLLMVLGSAIAITSFIINYKISTRLLYSKFLNNKPFMGIIIYLCQPILFALVIAFILIFIDVHMVDLFLIEIT